MADETKDLKRKNRSPSSNNAFALPRAKKQRIRSPQSLQSSTTNTNNRTFRGSIHDNKHNVSFCYVYDMDGVLPHKHLLKSKRIDVRIPIASLPYKSNPNVDRRQLWGGGAINRNLYSSDSDIVCILYHSGILTKYGMNIDLGFDPSAILNSNLSQNMNGNNHKNMINDYDFMYVRTSTHKLSSAEIEQEQTRTPTNNVVSQGCIGIGVILDVMMMSPSKTHTYHAVNTNGYYSRKWIHTKGNEVHASLRLKHVYPLTNANDLVIDSNHVHAMKSVPPLDHPHKKQKMNQKYQNVIRKMDVIGLEFNHQHRPCLKYNLAILSNAHVLLNHNDWKNEQNHHAKEVDDETHHEHEDKRYGHLLQFRLKRFILMMENDKYRLVLQITKSNHSKKYKLMQLQFVHNHIHSTNQRKQRHHNKIADDLSWSDLKWSDKGVRVRGKLYPINHVWLIKK
eukprot:226793_1